jgi:predicted  nucleic acid-binding Zn-ribbon protein
MKKECKDAWMYGCPICGGKAFKRKLRHIEKRRQERAWKKDQQT